MNNSAEYYRHSRTDIVSHISHGSERVLDVGCAEGLLGAMLKQQGRAKEVIGIELFPAAANVARLVLDRVICGDIESVDLKSHGLLDSSFDYILCADVLEHLNNPEIVLSKLVKLLKPDGKFIISLPNVRHWSVLFPLLFKGEWKCQPQGILDRTHLRFFTRTSAVELLYKSGLKVRECMPLMYRKIDRIGRLVSLGLLQDFVAVQWLIITSKRNIIDSNH
jgi:2-polyprenyl-3-methyl-5-hydroxy-6-metoxy-1,4-benzoquinol methylase